MREKMKNSLTPNSPDSTVGASRSWLFIKYVYKQYIRVRKCFNKYNLASLGSNGFILTVFVLSLFIVIIWYWSNTPIIFDS